MKAGFYRSEEGHVLPLYPQLNGPVTKHRRAARKGLSALSHEERRAYGEAVGAAILELQRRELRGGRPENPAITCASGTRHTTGAEIDAAIRAQQLADLHSYPGRVRRSRTPEQWRSLYDDAMKQKRRKR